MTHFFHYVLLCGQLDVCLAEEFNCGLGYCIEASGECDGFKDCQINTADEDVCGIVLLWWNEDSS